MFNQQKINAYVWYGKYLFAYFVLSKLRYSLSVCCLVFYLKEQLTVGWYSEC